VSWRVVDCESLPDLFAKLHPTRPSTICDGGC
jgi:hypothetical protein